MEHSHTIWCVWRSVYHALRINLLFSVHMESTICNALSLSPQITKHCAVWATHTSICMRFLYHSSYMFHVPLFFFRSNSLLFLCFIVLLVEPKAIDSSFFYSFSTLIKNFQHRTSSRIISEWFHIKLCTWSRTAFLIFHWAIETRTHTDSNDSRMCFV